MSNAVSVLRKRWLALAAIVVLMAVALAAGTLFAANERQEQELRPPSEQSVMDATDPGLAPNFPGVAAKPEPPQDGPGAGVNQVVPDTGVSDALAQWLADQPEQMGFITQEDAITADQDTMDWLLYQAVHKDVLTQEEADAVQAWYERRPSAEEAPELLNHQPVYLYRPGDDNSIRELLRETESR